MCPKGACEGDCISCCCLALADTSLFSGTLMSMEKVALAALSLLTSTCCLCFSVPVCTHYGFESCLNVICEGLGYFTF